MLRALPPQDHVHLLTCSGFGKLVSAILCEQTSQRIHIEYGRVIMTVTGPTTAKIASLEAEIKQLHAAIKPLLIDFYEAHTGDEDDNKKLNDTDAALQNLYQTVLTKEDQIEKLKQNQAEHQEAKPDLISWLRMTDWLS